MDINSRFPNSKLHKGKVIYLRFFVPRNEMGSSLQRVNFIGVLNRMTQVLAQLEQWMGRSVLLPIKSTSNATSNSIEVGTCTFLKALYISLNLFGVNHVFSPNFRPFLQSSSQVHGFLKREHSSNILRGKPSELVCERIKQTIQSHGLP